MSFQKEEGSFLKQALSSPEGRGNVGYHPDYPLELLEQGLYLRDEVMKLTAQYGVAKNEWFWRWVQYLPPYGIISFLGDLTDPRDMRPHIHGRAKTRQQRLSKEIETSSGTSIGVVLTAYGISLPNRFQAAEVYIPELYQKRGKLRLFSDGGYLTQFMWAGRGGSEVGLGRANQEDLGIFSEAVNLVKKSL